MGRKGVKLILTLAFVSLSVFGYSIYTALFFLVDNVIKSESVLGGKGKYIYLTSARGFVVSFQRKSERSGNQSRFGKGMFFGLPVSEVKQEAGKESVVRCWVPKDDFYELPDGDDPPRVSIAASEWGYYLVPVIGHFVILCFVLLMVYGKRIFKRLSDLMGNLGGNAIVFPAPFKGRPTIVVGDNPRENLEAPAWMRIIWGPAGAHSWPVFPKISNCLILGFVSTYRQQFNRKRSIPASGYHSLGCPFRISLGFIS